MNKSISKKPVVDKSTPKRDRPTIGGQPENDKDARDAGLSSATPDIDAAKSKAKKPKGNEGGNSSKA